MTAIPDGQDRREIRRDLALLILASSLLYGLALGARDLWNPNEPIYGQAVVEMAARGDWLVPYVNGQIFAEKPILYYWMALVASRLTGGVSELSLRVPSAFAGVASVVLVYLLVFPYAGRGRARLASLLFATTYMVWWGSRSVQMDLLVSTTTLGVLLPLLWTFDHGMSPRLGWVMAGVSAGLGFLAKGPVGWVCPGLVVLAYLVVTRRLKSSLRWEVLLGVLACFAVSFPWYGLLWMGGKTRVLEELLIRQNFTRFVEAWDHQAPWWYYLPYLAIDMAPWSWFLPLAARLPQRRPTEERLDLLAWLWIAAIVVFFSFSQSKRSPYILPVAPAVAILVSGAAERLFDGRLSRGRARGILGILAVFATLSIIGGTVMALSGPARYPDLGFEARTMGILLAGGGLATLMGFLFRGRAGLTVPSTAFQLVVAVYVLAGASTLPAADAFKSARPFCERVVALVHEDAPLASYRFWRFRGSYAYYTGREIRNLTSKDELADYFSTPTRVFLIVEGDEKLDEARPVLGVRTPLARAGVGGKSAYLFSNR